MGHELPVNIKDKSSLLHLLISDFCKKYIQAIEERKNSKKRLVKIFILQCFWNVSQYDFCHQRIRALDSN